VGLFNRKQPEVIATGAEIDAAAKALASGDDRLANQLCDRAGEHRQRVAAAILAASIDHTPQN
jgi:Cdc6-like AAA superfamily ATPase